MIRDKTIALDGFYAEKDNRRYLRRICFKDQETGKTLEFLINNFTLPSPAGRIILEMIQAASAHQTLLWNVSKPCQIAYLDRRPRLCAGSHH